MKKLLKFFFLVFSLTHGLMVHNDTTKPVYLKIDQSCVNIHNKKPIEISPKSKKFIAIEQHNPTACVLLQITHENEELVSFTTILNTQASQLTLLEKDGEIETITNC